MMEIQAKNQKHDGDADVSAEDETDENAKIFPQRLMEMLSDPDTTDAITWLPHGRAFIIINRQKFSNNVLPAYFRKTKYTSFTRKLNRWNFTRVTRGPELGAYYHEFFQRGNESLCTQMYCKNERAKFAVSKEPEIFTNGKEKKTEDDLSSHSTTSTNPAAAIPFVEPVDNTSQPLSEASDMGQMLHKNMMLSPIPTLQTALLRHQASGQDSVAQAMIHNAIRAFQSPLLLQQQHPQATLMRMQQMVALQQQVQMQRRLPNRSAYTTSRASAA